MRKPVMAGNWKMNKTRDEALQFIYSVSDKVPNCSELDSIICAPAIILRDLVKRKGDNLEIGSQNMHYAENGAYTGEISPLMLTTTGVAYSIIGHSERRTYYNETDESVNLKVKSALSHGIKPIVCCGETIQEREDGQTNYILERQISKALAGIDKSNISSVIIAYEPVWAIGTGRVASCEMAEEACAFIRQFIAKHYNKECADRIRIIYGGSMTSKNVADLMAQPNIDGGLVGGASLDPNSFIELCQKAIVKYQ